MAYTTPGTVAAGDVYTAAAHNIQVNNVIDLRSYQNRYATFKYTSGNQTLNSSTTWANLPGIGTTGDLVLNATAGDVIEAVPSVILNSTANTIYFDAVTIVSSSPVNGFGRGGAVTTNTNGGSDSQGVSGWYAASTGADRTIQGSCYYTLVSGDISGGTVTLRMRYATSAVATTVLVATVNNPFQWFVRNLGPVTT
jgi:hypothetical protein